MGENTSEIEREIATERHELDRNLEVLEQKAKDLADWRVHFRNHPGLILGAAAGVGFLAGALSVERPTPVVRSVPGLMPEAARVVRERGPKAQHVLETWERIAEALLGVGIAKVIDWVADAIPGFREQYVQAHGSSAGYAHSRPERSRAVYQESER